MAQFRQHDGENTRRGKENSILSPKAQIRMSDVITDYTEVKNETMMCPLSTQIDSKFRDDGSSVGNLQ
jgi:hypothetical protein